MTEIKSDKPPTIFFKVGVESEGNKCAGASLNFEIKVTAVSRILGEHHTARPLG